MISELLSNIKESMILIFQGGSKAPMQRIPQLRVSGEDGNDLYFSSWQKEGLCLTQPVAQASFDFFKPSPGPGCPHSVLWLPAKSREGALAAPRASPAPLGTQNPGRALLSGLLTALINFKWHRVLSTTANGALHSFEVIFGVSNLFANQGRRVS